MEKEFDMSTNKGRLDYAKKYFTIGTKYIPRHADGSSWERECEIIFTPVLCIITGQIEGGRGYIYSNGKWAELIKEEEKMETQKLTRKGLKEIHSVACSTWKVNLENYSKRNTLEEFIELTNIEVGHMFNSCTKDQLPIVSKYLKQDDGSVDVTNFPLSGKGFCDGNFYIIRDSEWGEYKKQSFLLSQRYDWEIKTDNVGQLCLIPTKKK